MSWLRQPERSWVSLDSVHVATRDVAARVASSDVVSRALSALPENNRLALSLFLVDGYTYQEVAELTDVSLATVRGRIQRARRKLAMEALDMVEGALKDGAPDEEFTLDTVRASIDRAQEIMGQRDLTAARSAAEEALEKLSKLEGAEEERRSLRLDALGIVGQATRFAEPERSAETTREAIRICEDAGDMGRLAGLLDYLAGQDGKLTETERDALAGRALELYRDAGHHDQIGHALFFRGWDRIYCGESEEGFRRLDEARDALKEVPYGGWHACLDAPEEFRKLTGGGPDKERMVQWGAMCDVVKVDGERLSFCSQPGYACHTGKQEEMAKFGDGFGLLSRTGWLPHTGPGPGYEDDKDTFSYTGNPTHTRVWIEADDASATTPAGEYDGCLLVRATVTESDLDAESESPQRKRNEHWCGERRCWLARGVGPVAYRHEPTDGIVVHTLLSKFECPEQREEWVPVVVGTRWDDVPAEPGEDFDALVIARLTHIGEDGRAYVAETTAGTRR